MKKLLPVLLFCLFISVKGEDYYDYRERESIRIGEYFTCTPQYLFAFDEDGGIKWKTKIDRMPKDIMDSPDYLCLSWDREVKIYDRKDGKLFLQKTFPEKIWALGKVENHPEMFFALASDKIYLLDAKSGKIEIKVEDIKREIGKILKITLEKKGAPAKGEITIKSVEEITIGLSDKYIFGFLPDGGIKWKIEREGYNIKEGWDDYIELWTSKKIKVIKKSTGETVWEKSFPYPIKEYEGRTLRKIKITSETGKVYTFDIETGEVEE